MHAKFFFTIYFIYIKRNILRINVEQIVFHGKFTITFEVTIHI